MSFFSAAPPSSWASTVSISTRATQAPGLAVRMAAHVTSEPRPTPRPASSVRARSATRPRCARSPWPTRATPALAWTVALARWKVWTVTRARVRLALLVSSGYHVLSRGITTRVMLRDEFLKLGKHLTDVFRDQKLLNTSLWDETHLNSRA